MPREDREETLRAFVNESRFQECGAVMLDMDGTALYERDGIVYIPDSVTTGLKAVHDLKRPIILNTLRFPLSIMSTFGPDWYRINEAPIPTVLLNGSLIGCITMGKNGELGYDEIESFPLTREDILEVMVGVEGLVKGGVNVLVFYYPRDWRLGEILWTSHEGDIPELKEKYLSASDVVSTSVEELKHQLLSGDVNMILMLANAEDDQLMAYQHTKKNSFFTRAGVDKASGAKYLANHLGISLDDSLGAGDTELDCFLPHVGLAIKVGPRELALKGTKCTLSVPDAFELGDTLIRFAELERSSNT